MQRDPKHNDRPANLTKQQQQGLVNENYSSSAIYCNRNQTMLYSYIRIARIQISRIFKKDPCLIPVNSFQTLTKILTLSV